MGDKFMVSFFKKNIFKKLKGSFVIMTIFFSFFDNYIYFPTTDNINRFFTFLDRKTLIFLMLISLPSLPC